MLAVATERVASMARDDNETWLWIGVVTALLFRVPRGRRQPQRALARGGCREPRRRQPKDER